MQTISETYQLLSQVKANLAHHEAQKARRERVNRILATVGECEQVERMAKGGR